MWDVMITVPVNKDMLQHSINILHLIWHDTNNNNDMLTLSWHLLPKIGMLTRQDNFVIIGPKNHMPSLTLNMTAINNDMCTGP